MGFVGMVGIAMFDLIHGTIQIGDFILVITLGGSFFVGMRDLVYRIRTLAKCHADLEEYILIPVSYTHLDVYKRQVYYRMLKRIERFVKTHRIDLIFLTIFIGLLAFAYRRLLSDISGSLMDRYDFPYIVWVVNSNIQNILHGNLAHYFDTRGFYPHPYGLLFSDILLPQSLLVLPIYLLTRNIILSFNSILLLSLIHI